MIERVAADPPAMLTSKQVAELLSVSDKTLRNWRVEGRGPRFIRLSAKGGTVRYPRHEVDAYLTVCFARSA